MEDHLLLPKQAETRGWRNAHDQTHRMGAGQGRLRSFRVGTSVQLFKGTQRAYTHKKRPIGSNVRGGSLLVRVAIARVASLGVCEPMMWRQLAIGVQPLVHHLQHQVRPAGNLLLSHQQPPLCDAAVQPLTDYLFFTPHLQHFALCYVPSPGVLTLITAARVLSLVHNWKRCPRQLHSLNLLSGWNGLLCADSARFLVQPC